MSSKFLLDYVFIWTSAELKTTCSLGRIGSSLLSKCTTFVGCLKYFYRMGDDWLRRCMLTNWTELEWNIQFCRGDGCCWVRHCWYEKEWTKKIERREGVRWYRSSSPPLWLRPALLPVGCVGLAGCQLSQKIYKWQMQILKARILSKESTCWLLYDYNALAARRS